MSRKYIKSIFMGVRQGPDGPLLKATVAAKTEIGAFPSYIKVYHVTGGRAKHIERILLRAAKKKFTEASDERRDPTEREKLSAIVADILRTVVMVAKTAEVAYNQPMSVDAVNALEILQLFQVLSIRQMLQEQESHEDSRTHRYPGENPQPGSQSFFGRQSLFN